MDRIYITKDGCNIVTLDDKCILRLWDLKTGRLLWTSNVKASAIALSAIGCKIICVGSSLIQVINTKTGEFLFDMEGHTSWINTSVSTPDGRSLITGSHDNTLRVWDIESGQCRSVFFKRGVAEIAFGNIQKSQIIIGSFNGDVEFYSIENLPLIPFITTTSFNPSLGVIS